MLRVSMVENALEDIGWGKYHTKLFFNCAFVIFIQGWGIANMWVQTVSLIYKEFDTVFSELDDTTKSYIPTSFNVGCAIGIYIFSMMTDKYGRSFIFKKTIYVTCVSSVLLILSEGFWAIVVSCCILGIGVGGDIALPPSVFIESIPPSLRARGTLMNMGYCVGPFLSSLSMQMVELWWVGPLPKWKFFVCIMAAITVIVAIVRHDILESPIFLYRSRDSNFHYVIREIAQSNGRSSYDDMTVPFLFKETEDPDYQLSYGLKDIFKGKFFAITTILTINQLFFVFSLYGILFFEPSLLKILAPEEQYYIQVSDQIFGITGIFVSVYAVDGFLGRKYTYTISSFICGIFTCMVVVYPWPPYILLVLSGLLRLSLLIALAGKNLLAPESYPHYIRGIGIGFVFTISKFMSIASTIVIGLMKQYVGNNEIMYLIGGTFIITAIFTLFLTETKPAKRVE